MFKVQHYKTIPLTILSESTIYANDCIIECFEAIDEGSNNCFFLNESDSYLASMMLDTLENVRKYLVDIFNKLLEYLTTYIVNSISALKRLREKLLLLNNDALDKIKYKTYEYPRLHELPKKIKKDIPTVKRDEEFKKMVSISSMERIDHTNEIDKNIDEFASEVFDSRIRFAGDSIEKVISETSYKLMKGDEKLLPLSTDTLDKIIAEILDYKKLKDGVIKSRAEMLEYYEKLKSTMENTYKTETSNNGRDIRSMYDKQMGYLTDEQTDNLSFGLIEANRLYGSYIQIYQTAFKCKLSILKSKIDDNKALIRDLLKVAYLPEGLRISKKEAMASSKLLY